MRARPFATTGRGKNGHAPKIRNGNCIRRFANLPDLTKRVRMNKDDLHPLRTGRGFFSKMLLGIRRLAALTRSPVPIAWMADGRARANSHDLGRWMGRLTLPAERGSPGSQHPRTLRRPAG